MTERELSAAIMRKAKQKFQDITEAQTSAVARAAVDFGIRVGALDDKNYAEAKVRSGVRTGKSQRIIAQKLREKGVEAETAKKALEDADDRLAAISFARKRGFGPYRRQAPDDKRLAKELSAFARNGFSFELARAVLEMDANEADTAVIQESI